MSRKHLTGPESKDVLGHQNNIKKEMGVSHGQRGQPEKASYHQSWKNVNEKINRDCVGL